MKKKISILIVLLVLIFSFTSCESEDLSGNTSTSTSTDTNDENTTISTTVDEITNGGDYTLSGDISETIVVNAKGEDVTLVLDNVNIDVTDGPAIYIKKASSVTIEIKDGTSNTISDGTSYEYVDDTTTIDAAIFSKADLVVTGDGSLSIDGNYKHGIVSKDTLTIDSTVDLNVESASCAIEGKDSVTIVDSTISINSGSDGIRTTNEEDTSLGNITIENSDLTIVSGNDCIQSINDLTIESGTFNLSSAGASIVSTESYKGLKATNTLTVNGGTFVIDTLDDAVHSNLDITINDGTFTIDSGDDGLHADNDLVINNGTIDVNSSYEGLEGLTITINDGTISLYASDDGINTAGGTDSSGFGGQFQGGFSSGNSDCNLEINGGYVYINASGDGIDSNGSIELNGGVTLIDGPTSSADAPFDYEIDATLNGGVLFATGSSGMAENFSESNEQAVFLATISSGLSANGELSVVDSEGNVVLSFAPTKTIYSMLVTSPDLVVGDSYTVYSGGTVANSDSHGYATNSTLDGGTSLGTLTISSTITGQGSQMGGGMGQGGSMPGQGGNMGKGGMPGGN